MIPPIYGTSIGLLYRRTHCIYLISDNVERRAMGFTWSPLLEFVISYSVQMMILMIVFSTRTLYIEQKKKLYA